ncbi:hypothetical protein TIFTF001_010782 [Ficus carica]|uniref:Uncharacterized protein n=1 Tax=Ficus carica TaxID=3494 RepID=A0AA88AK77_FICCA|nr:hypothetical protein TIFTF001_010782 [Ficus carica]
MSGWNISKEGYQFYVHNEESQAEKYITSNPPRPKHHFAFKTDYEEVREYERDSAGLRVNYGGFKAEEDVNKEADEFIKMEHKKFLRSRTTSA